MDFKPLVSLVLLSYNHEKYIIDCFESILIQKYENLEILYVDDYSQDNSFIYAKIYYEKFIKKGWNCSFIRNKENYGLVKNLNILINKCKGMYVKFLATDDFLLPYAIEYMVEYMMHNPTYDMVFGNGITVDRDTHFPLKSLKQFNMLYNNIPPSGDSISSLLYERDYISAPSVMIDINVYSKIGLYDEKIGVEDWDFFLRVAKQGSIGYLDKLIVAYRFLDDSLSHSNNIERRMNMHKSCLAILEKHQELHPKAIKIMNKKYNEVLRDAYSIRDKSFYLYLDEYRYRNHLHVTLYNRIRSILW